MLSPYITLNELLKRFETCNGGIISLNDSGCSIKIDLKDHSCLKIHIDGKDGLTEITCKKCDWCIKDLCSQGKYMFIEMKSQSEKSVIKAAKQIESTIIWFNNNISDFSLNMLNKNCYIVMSHCVPKITTSIQNAKKNFYKSFKSNLNIIKQNKIIPLNS